MNPNENPTNNISPTPSLASTPAEATPQPNEQSMPQPSTVSSANNIETPQKNKKPIIIAIIAILVLATIGIVTFIILSQSNKEGSSQSSQNKSESKTTAEHKDKSRLKKDNYTIADINEGFSFATISFTGNSDIRIGYIESEESQIPDYNFEVYVNDGNKDHLVRITIVNSYGEHETIQTINEACEKNTNCDSDYIDGAKTLLTTMHTNYNDEYYFYSSTKSGQLISYYTHGQEDESAARKLLVKAAMSISDDNGKPYLVDMVMLLKYPDNRHVRSYRDIIEIEEDTILIRPTSTEEPVSILVVQSPREDAELKEVSSNPKIDSLTYYGASHGLIRSNEMNYTFFRFYDDNGSSVDIAVYLLSDNNITKLDEAQKYLNLLDK